MEKILCRICYDDDEENDRKKISEKLIKPCKCTSSVHAKCLNHWRFISNRRNRCDVCLSTYEKLDRISPLMIRIFLIISILMLTVICWSKFICFMINRDILIRKFFRIENFTVGFLISLFANVVVIPMDISFMYRILTPENSPFFHQFLRLAYTALVLWFFLTGTIIRIPLILYIYYTQTENNESESSWRDYVDYFFYKLHKFINSLLGKISNWEWKLVQMANSI